MKIRCVSTTISEEQAHQLDIEQHVNRDYRGFVVIGKEYTVYGLSIRGQGIWVEMLGEGFAFPVSAPLCLFEIVDGRVSKYWEARNKDGWFTLWPPSFYSNPYYFEDLSDDVPEVVEHFKLVRAIMENEWKEI
jgi:hypothetical protein